MISPVFIGNDTFPITVIGEAIVNGDATLFYATDMSVMFLDIKRRNGFTLFGTVRMNNTETAYWFNEGLLRSREAFIELVMRDYPDHFEWFLFHPELLNQSYIR